MNKEVTAGDVARALEIYNSMTTNEIAAFLAIVQLMKMEASEENSDGGV